jgi:hypothetical protein
LIGSLITKWKLIRTNFRLLPLGRHDITEILLKVALSTQKFNQSINLTWIRVCSNQKSRYWCILHYFRLLPLGINKKNGIKASRQLNVLKRIGKQLSKLGRLTIYHTYISRHDIAEILLKVALSTQKFNQSINLTWIRVCSNQKSRYWCILHLTMLCCLDEIYNYSIWHQVGIEYTLSEQDSNSQLQCW